MKDIKLNTEIFPGRLQEALGNSSENTHSLASQLSLTPSTISRYTNGRMAPKVPTVFMMAEALNVNPLWLMGYDEPKFTAKKPATPEGDELTTKKRALIEKIKSLDDSDIEVVSATADAIIARRDK